MRKQAVPIIHIIGLPGAGKTTLARGLSKVLKIPILCIGRHRAQFPKTPIGEAGAWLALFRELSHHRWKNCILETTGLNSRGGFLRSALPFGQIVTIKLEASRKTLFRRIGLKRKKDRGGQWFYSAAYRDKYEFVRKLFKNFSKVHADCYIDTNRLSEINVFRKAFNKINSIKEMMPDG
jgi:hypothetical protein